NQKLIKPQKSWSRSVSTWFLNKVTFLCIVISNSRYLGIIQKQLNRGGSGSLNSEFGFVGMTAVAGLSMGDRQRASNAGRRAPVGNPCFRPQACRLAAHDTRRPEFGHPSSDAAAVGCRNQNTGRSLTSLAGSTHTLFSL